MTTAPHPRAPRRRWWRWQFSLRTLLVLMTLTAVVAWWYRRPALPELAFSGGLRQQARLVLPKSDDPFTEASYAVGPRRVLDQHGRLLLAASHNAKGDLQGALRLHHTSGRTALAGSIPQPTQAETWTEWDEAGRKRATLALAGKLDRQSYDNCIGALPTTRRAGPARLWWPSGQLQAEGGFRANRREGPWKFYDEQGELRSAGQYRRGRKHGIWQERTGGGDVLGTVEYWRGVPLTNVDQALAACSRALAAGTTVEQRAAIERLSQLGPRGVERLSDLAASDDDALALSALEALARLGEDAASAAESLAALLERTDLSHERRLATLAALAHLDAAERERHVLAWLRLAPHPASTSPDRLLIIGLLLIHDPPLARRLLDSPDVFLRHRALALVGALMEMEPWLVAQKETSPDLAERWRAWWTDLKTHPDPTVQRAAGKYEQLQVPYMRWGCCVF